MNYYDIITITTRLVFLWAFRFIGEFNVGKRIKRTNSRIVNVMTKQKLTIIICTFSTDSMIFRPVPLI